MDWQASLGFTHFNLYIQQKLENSLAKAKLVMSSEAEGDTELEIEVDMDAGTGTGSEATTQGVLTQSFTWRAILYVLHVCPRPCRHY